MRASDADIGDLHLDERHLGGVPAGGEVGIAGDVAISTPAASPASRMAASSDSSSRKSSGDRCGRLPPISTAAIAQGRGLAQKDARVEPVLAPVAGVADGEQRGDHGSRLVG